MIAFVLVLVGRDPGVPMSHKLRTFLRNSRVRGASSDFRTPQHVWVCTRRSVRKEERRQWAAASGNWSLIPALVMVGWFRWVPQSRGWRRDPLYRGGGERFFSQWRKEGGTIGNLLEKVFEHFIGCSSEAGTPRRRASSCRHSIVRHRACPATCGVAHLFPARLPSRS
jgi:hypothetical protein